MNYSKIKFNDIANGPGICVSFWVQGCNLHCKNCHNSSIWNFNEGITYTEETVNLIVNGLNKNNIKRHLSILGGEPLDERNQPMVNDLIKKVKNAIPEIKIYLWTGYTFDTIPKTKYINFILNNINVLIDGPYVENLKQNNLPMRGSTNQRILYKGKDF